MWGSCLAPCGTRCSSSGRIRVHGSHLPPIRPAVVHRGCCVATKATAAPATNYKPVPEIRGGLPWFGALTTCPVDELFLLVEREFASQGGRCLDLLFCGEHAIHCRHPEDISRALRNPNTWIKTSDWKKLDRWLGNGLVSELDAATHARAREVLAPAFRAHAVKGLVPLFADVAGQLTQLMLTRQGQAVELQPLMRRATLDVIGKAGFGYDFRALATLAQQQQQQQAQAQQHTTAKSAGQDYIDVVKAFDDVLSPAMLLICNLPLPDFLLPGYQGYLRGIQQLEVVVGQVLKERREQGISPGDCSLLSFMLAAQQADPNCIVTDKHIRDQLMTFMLAGSDTTATTLAFCLHELARRPEVLQRVQQEVQQVLGDTPTDKLAPEAFTSLPLLTGCINESLRLFPAAPGLTRIATQEAVYGEHLLPAGTILVLDIFSCHRNPEFWLQPTEWLPERWLPGNVRAMGPQHPDAFIPFSGGARSCIGRYFAVLEMQVILALLLRQMRLSAVQGDQQQAVRLVQSFTLSACDSLLVVPEACGA